MGMRPSTAAIADFAFDFLSPLRHAHGPVRVFLFSSEPRALEPNNLRLEIWYARLDSNQRPFAPEANGHEA